MSVEWAQLIPQIAHDVRSLVRRGVSNAQFLERHLALAPESQAAGHLREVIESQVELNRLVVRIMALSDASVARGRSTDLEVVVLGAKLDCREAVQRAGAEVVVKELPNCSVPESTQIVFRELIQNALRYADSERAPRILIEAEDGGEWIQMRISDNGTGLAEGYEDKLFQPFQRLDATRSGFGLGLAICREILETAGGRIRYERANPGATFVFELPNHRRP